MAEATVKGMTHVSSEDGRIWLPKDIFTDPWDSRETSLGTQPLRRRFPIDAGVPRHINNHSAKFGGWKTHHKSRYPGNRWASTIGGPGMQAIFLETGRRSCGTGFFLPLRADSQHLQPTKKPVCSIVLLPSRVVQALNLNVHQLGNRLSKPTKTEMVSDIDVGSKKVGSTFLKEVKDGGESEVDKIDKCGISPELLLPPEWTY